MPHSRKCQHARPNTPKLESSRVHRLQEVMQRSGLSVVGTNLEGGLAPFGLDNPDLSSRHSGPSWSHLEVDERFEVASSGRNAQKKVLNNGQFNGTSNIPANTVSDIPAESDLHSELLPLKDSDAILLPPAISHENLCTNGEGIGGTASRYRRSVLPILTDTKAHTRIANASIHTCAHTSQMHTRAHARRCTRGTRTSARVHTCRRACNVACVHACMHIHSHNCQQAHPS